MSGSTGHAAAVPVGRVLIPLPRCIVPAIVTQEISSAHAPATPSLAMPQAWVGVSGLPTELDEGLQSLG